MTDFQYLDNYHLFFSQKAANWRGSVFYIQEDGTEFEITNAAKDEHYSAASDTEKNWDDTKYLGRIRCQYSRKGQEKCELLKHIFDTSREKFYIPFTNDRF